MKKSVKIILGIISAAMAVVCVMCILYIVQYVRGNSLNDKLANDIASDMTVAVPKADTAGSEETAAPDAEPQQDATDAEPKKKFRSINFGALTELNPDIYAWIKIDGTTVDYPVSQNNKDDW